MLPPQPFKGAITPEEAARGMDVAFRNARSLIDDAQALLAAGRWPRAVALAIVAVEEAAKPGVLRGLLLAGTDEVRRREWRAYRTHTEKNAMTRFMAYVLTFMKKSKRVPLIEDMRPFFSDKDSRRDIELLKQFAMYTDCVDDVRWTMPDELFDESAARAFVTVADEVVGSGPGAMTSLEELRLWVKHLAPTWGTDMESMKKSLAECYEEAADARVLRGVVSADRMADFLDLVEPET